jgi:PAS domain S-box-containing protein
LFVGNPLDRGLLEDFLVSLGHAVSAPESGEANSIAPGVSLVIVDERTAQRHGAAIFQIRWRSSAAFLPILILLPLRSNPARWLQAGFDDVLRQPITKEELRARLAVFSRLRSQSEQYRQLFENALIGIYRCGLDGRLLVANEALITRLGFASFDALARAGLAQRRLEPGHDAIVALLAERGLVTGLESSWQRQDGTMLYALENARAVREGSRMLYVEGSIEDIGERKRSEKERELLLARAQAARVQAETASRLKDEFLATVSHELRTPLTAIIGWAHLLRSGKLRGDAVAGALEVIERQARTQAQLVEDLLDVSRIITGKLRLDLQAVVAQSFVAAGIEAVRPAAEAKGVRIREDMPAAPAILSGDQARLQQVVWNLLSNAVKFTRSGGEVSVRLRCDERLLTLEVADDGDGIDPDFLPFVFERFRQHDGTTTRAHGGLGLGLAIVRHLVELHGGTADAHSDGKGLGARFTVRLPLGAGAAAGIPAAPGERSENAAAPATLPRGALSGTKILLVDDDSDALEVLAMVLRGAGAEVVAAESATHAWQQMHERRFDLLVSDISMPQVGGYALIAQVRRHFGPSIRAAALTASASSEDRTRALVAGFDRHIAKPVEPDALVALLAELAGGSTKPG